VRSFVVPLFQGGVAGSLARHRVPNGCCIA
jgi:hypothetical protein